MDLFCGSGGSGSFSKKKRRKNDRKLASNIHFLAVPSVCGAG